MLRSASGARPALLITSTPRPTGLIREIIAQKTTVQTQSSTYANSANLAPDYIDLIIADYVGTRLGRQEIYGEILEDVPGALWHHQGLDELRVKAPDDLKRSWWPSIRRSPAARKPTRPASWWSAQTSREAYVLADLSARPDRLGSRGRQGLPSLPGQRGRGRDQPGRGDGARHAAPGRPSLPVKMVRAKRGKYQRAEPAAALYEQGRVHHVGCHAALEDQMCRFTATSIAVRAPRPRRCPGLGIDPPAGQAPRTGGGAEHQPLRRRAHPTAGRRLDLDPRGPPRRSAAACPLGPPWPSSDIAACSPKNLPRSSQVGPRYLDIQLPGPPGHGYVV